MGNLSIYQKSLQSLTKKSIKHVHIMILLISLSLQDPLTDIDIYIAPKKDTRLHISNVNHVIKLFPVNNLKNDKIMFKKAEKDKYIVMINGELICHQGDDTIGICNEKSKSKSITLRKPRQGGSNAYILKSTYKFFSLGHKMCLTFKNDKLKFKKCNEDDMEQVFEIEKYPSDKDIDNDNSSEESVVDNVLENAFQAAEVKELIKKDVAQKNLAQNPNFFISDNNQIDQECDCVKAVNYVDPVRIQNTLKKECKFDKEILQGNESIPVEGSTIKIDTDGIENEFEVGEVTSKVLMSDNTRDYNETNNSCAQKSFNTILPKKAIITDVKPKISNVASSNMYSTKNTFQKGFTNKSNNISMRTRKLSALSPVSYTEPILGNSSCHVGQSNPQRKVLILNSLPIKQH